MDALKLIVVIGLIASGCITPDPAAIRQRAVNRLSTAGYAVDAVVSVPRITVLPNARAVSAECFMRTGQYVRKPGFYDSTAQEIVISGHAGFAVWLHEYEHFILHMLGVPLKEHHQIMNSL